MYYLKAQQYKEKTKIKDTCEAMLDLLEKRTQVGKKNLISGQKTQFYKLAK